MSSPTRECRSCFFYKAYHEDEGACLVPLPPWLVPLLPRLPIHPPTAPWKTCGLYTLETDTSSSAH